MDQVDELTTSLLPLANAGRAIVDVTTCRYRIPATAEKDGASGLSPFDGFTEIMDAVILRNFKGPLRSAHPFESGTPGSSGKRRFSRLL